MHPSSGTHALRCPACNDSDASYPDPQGVYHCTFCGARYMLGPTGHPQLAPARKASVNTTAIVIVVVGFVVLLVAATIALVYLGMNAEAEREREMAAVEEDLRADQAAVDAFAPGNPDEVFGGSVPVGGTGSTAKAAIEPAPPPKAAPTADFVLHNKQSGYKESYYALGEVTNTSPFAIDKPKVIAVLLDEQGGEVSTDFGFASLDVLQPGETSPVKVLIKDPPAHADVRFEVVAREARYFPEMVEGLELQTSPARRARIGKGFELEGKVLNKGSAPAKFILVQAKAVNAEGKIVGLADTYADVEVLQPGAEARYNFVSVLLDQEPDHFEFTVRGRKAD